MPLALLRQHIDSGKLVTVLDRCAPRAIDVNAVWPRTAQLRPRRYVVDTLVSGRSEDDKLRKSCGIVSH
jgi:hypothetical protein